MAFQLIRGTFHVVGYSPDGDSIRFRADDPSRWGLLDGPRPRINGNGHAQLRLEAIDTLETHFNGVHQPLALAERAMAHLLELVGIRDVVWDANHLRVTSAVDGTPGYIVAREVEKNGRPVSFAFADGAPVQDGEVYLDPALVSRSVNARMLVSGLAYPTYYKGLFADLRNALTQAVASARAVGVGVWASDATNSGFAVTSLATITDEVVMLPKLFRRLAEYLEGGGTVGGFSEFLAARPEEVLVISSVHQTHLDNLVEEHGNRIRLAEPPENLLFAG